MKTIPPLLLIFVTALSWAQGPVDLQALVNEAIQKKSPRLTLAPGTYRVSVPASQLSHLKMEGAQNLVIHAEGVRLLCTSVKRAVEIVGCTNLELVGLTVDYDPLPFSQGQVISVDPDDNGFTMKTHSTYPAIGVEEGDVYLFDGKTRQWKTGAWSGGRKARFSQQGDTVHAVLAESSARWNVGAGDFWVVKQKSLNPHVVSLASCSQTTLRGVTLHTGPTFAILDNDGDANAYLDVRITPGPRPIGATEDRLMANTADGIHCIGARRGPRIEGCLIEGHSDDGVAIHGKYALVLKAFSNVVSMAYASESVPYSPGEMVRLTAGATGAILGEAKVLGVTRVEGSEKNVLEAEKMAMKLGNKNLYTALRAYWEVVLDRPSGLGQGDVLDAPSHCGSGFVVRNNTIRNHRARGILIKASEGVIENNHIEHSSIAGIVLAPEIAWWLEAGYSWNVVIRSNRVLDCGYEHPNPGHSQSGMISVCAAGMSRGQFAPVGGQRGIRILSNTVENCKGLSLLITSARDITVQGNTFVRPLEANWSSGTLYGTPSNAVVFLENAEQVRLGDNRVEKPGPFMKEFVTRGTNAPEGPKFEKGAFTGKASRLFSGVSGPLGWSYASFDGKVFETMQWNPGKKQWEGPGSYCHVYGSAQHPGNTHDSARRWVAPESGSYQITGAPKAPTTADGVRLRILKGTDTLWEVVIPPDQKGVTFPHDLRVTLSQGDTISFVVGRKGENGGDYTAWDPLIEVAP